MNEYSLEKEKPIKTLYIDDSESATNFMRFALEGDSNFIIIECHSVEEALKAIEEYKPDILFIDNSLSPLGDEGLDVINKLRKDESKIEIFSITDNDGVAEILEKEFKIERIEKGDYLKMKEIIAEAQVKKDTKER